MADLVFATASELVAAIRKRRISAAEALEAHLEQIERFNPALGAVVTLDAEGARARAREADAALAAGESWGPLHGLPITLEDCHATAGLRSTWGGAPALARHVPREDSVVTARLRAAGAIVFGKTNGPLIWGDESAYGRTNNPWDTERSPGGSSGGPAAAVAAGLTPLDIGLDTTGSILGPAHCCGVFGMRPTERRVSLRGAFFVDPVPKFHVMSVLGPIARSVEDLRMALRVIAGPDSRDPAIPPVQWRDIPAPPIRELRVAWAPTLPGMPIIAEARAAIEQLAGELDRLGARVDQRLPDVDLAEQARFCQAMFWLIAGAFGPPNEPKPTLDDYLAALHRRESFALAWERFFHEWDVLLCPAGPGVARRHDQEATFVNGQPIPEAIADLPYGLSPVSGCPAVVLPLSSDRDGLPIGMQAIGRRWDDERLLAVAVELAELTGGFRRPPGYG
jgi:amidase